MADSIQVTGSGKRAINAARNEARALRRSNVGTEHLLLGVLTDPGAAASVLRGITLDAAREMIISILGRGIDDTDVSQLVYSPRSKKILTQSADEAKALGQDAVSVEHILLALMREREGVAARVLCKMGLDLDRAREELLHALGAKVHGDSSENSGNVMPDWKKPLYEYAVNQERSWSFSKLEELKEIYTLLGGYQDADERLKGVLSKAQSEFEREADTVNRSDDIGKVERALRNLRDMNGYGDSVAAIAKGEEHLNMLRERERAEQEARERAEKRKKRMYWLIAATAAVVVVIAAVAYYQVILPGYVRKGDELLGQGQYAEAIASYEKASREDKTVEAQIEWGKALCAELDYEGAIEHFREAGEENYTYDAYRAWSDHLAETDSAAAAIEMLYNTPESSEREARLAELQLQRADESLALLKEHDQSGEKDSDYARELGQPISDLTSQLKYCRGLAEAGYNLNSVYPEGVNVSNVPLGQYQIEDIQDIEDGKLDLDTSRMLLFERTEKPFEDYYEYSPELPLRDRHDDSLFDVKLLPGQMFDLMPDAVAENWDDASCIVLLDNIYVESGTITHTETRTMNGIPMRTTSKDYPYYSAISSICAYSKDTPQIGTVMDIESVDPICANDEWFNQNKGSTTVLQGRYRVGIFNYESLYEDLTVSLLLLSLI